MGDLLFKKLSPNATTPVRATEESAGYDIAAAGINILPPMKCVMVKTDLQMCSPPGTYIRLASRSGLALLNIHVAAGVIDRDYRGNVGVLLINLNQYEFRIAKGDRIANAIVEKIIITQTREVEDLDQTQRGGEGFGSSGLSGPPIKKRRN